MSSTFDATQPLKPGNLQVTVHLKATRTTVHDLALALSVPAESATSHAAVRRYLETIQPGVFAQPVPTRQWTTSPTTPSSRSWPTTPPRRGGSDG
ncbi:MAG: hypothetical protein JO362_15840 [Streptomycetaceae bacterium]|nr:hypothetical protein [Streptomycetaceae bacterium]